MFNIDSPSEPTVMHYLISFFLLGISVSCQAGEITVYAAASLTNALGDIVDAYQSAHPGTVVKTSFAASGILARQIENGAPADLFISADSKWMDYLAGKGRIDGDSRVNLLGNTLVLISPRDRPLHVEMRKDFAFAQAFTGKLCTGETGSVPAGIYAREALIYLGWWNSIKARIVGTEDVRAALNLVERGECSAGIVYATDAVISDKVTVAAKFPDNSHAPIVYPVGLVTRKSEGLDFLDYLKTATALFTQHGFEVITR